MNNFYGKKAEVLMKLANLEKFKDLIPNSYYMSNEVFNKFLDSNLQLRNKINGFFYNLKNSSESEDGYPVLDVLNRYKTVDLRIESDYFTWLEKYCRKIHDDIVATFNEDLIIVRSSGMEDDSKFTNAGGNLSIPNVSAKNILSAIAKVTASYFSTNSLLQVYQETGSFDFLPNCVSDYYCPVIIQEMIYSNVIEMNNKENSSLLPTQVLQFISKKVMKLREVLNYDVVDTEWVLKTDKGTVSMVALSNESNFGGPQVTITCSFGVGSSAVIQSDTHSITYMYMNDERFPWSITKYTDNTNLIKVSCDLNDIYLVQARPYRKMDRKILRNKNIKQFFNNNTFSSLDGGKKEIKVISNGSGDNIGKIITGYTLAEAWYEYMKMNKNQQEDIIACCICQGTINEHAGIMLTSLGVPILKLDYEDFYYINKINKSNNFVFITGMFESKLYFLDDRNNYQPQFEIIYDFNYAPFVKDWSVYVHNGLLDYITMNEFHEVYINKSDMIKNLFKFINDTRNLGQKMINSIKNLSVFQKESSNNRLNIKVINELIQFINECLSLIKNNLTNIKICANNDGYLIYNVILYLLNYLHDLVQYIKESEKLNIDEIKKVSFAVYCINSAFNNELKVISDKFSLENSLNFNLLISEIEKFNVEDLQTIFKNIGELDWNGSRSNLINKLKWLIIWKYRLNFENKKIFSEYDTNGYSRVIYQFNAIIMIKYSPIQVYELYKKIESNNKKVVYKYLINGINSNFSLETIENLFITEEKLHTTIDQTSKIINKYEGLIKLLLSSDTSQESINEYCYLIRFINQFGGQGDTSLFIDFLYNYLLNNGKSIEGDNYVKFVSHLKSKKLSIDINKLIRQYYRGVPIYGTDLLFQDIGKIHDDIIIIKSIISKNWLCKNELFYRITSNIFLNIINDFIELLDLVSKTYAHSFLLGQTKAYENYFKTLEYWISTIPTIFSNSNKNIEYLYDYCSKQLDYIINLKRDDLLIDYKYTWKEKLEKSKKINIHELHNVLHQSFLYFANNIYSFQSSSTVLELQNLMISFGLVNRKILHNKENWIEIELGVGKQKYHKSSLTISHNYIMAQYTEGEYLVESRRLFLLNKWFNLLNIEYDEFMFITNIEKSAMGEVLRLIVRRKDKMKFNNWNDIYFICQTIRIIFDSSEQAGGYKISKKFNEQLLNSTRFHNFLLNLINYGRQLEHTKYLPSLGGDSESSSGSLFQHLLHLVSQFPEKFLAINCTSLHDAKQKMEKNLNDKYFYDWPGYRKWLRDAYGLVLAIQFPEDLFEESIMGNKKIIPRSKEILYLLQRKDFAERLIKMIVDEKKQLVRVRYLELLQKYNPAKLVMFDLPEIHTYIHTLLETSKPHYYELGKCYIALNVYKLIQLYDQNKAYLNLLFKNYSRDGAIWLDKDQWEQIVTNEKVFMNILSVFNDCDILKVYDCRTEDKLIYSSQVI